MSIEVGQVYASTHKGDIASGQRQRRVVERVDGQFVWLRTEDARYGQSAPLSRLRWRVTAEGQRIPGHRLVEDVSLRAETIVWADGTIYDPSIPGYRQATGAAA